MSLPAPMKDSSAVQSPAVSRCRSATSPVGGGLEKGGGCARDAQREAWRLEWWGPGQQQPQARKRETGQRNESRMFKRALGLLPPTGHGQDRHRSRQRLWQEVIFRAGIVVRH
eukprot:7539299-Alexandrium_andersonii.AAC.1